MSACTFGSGPHPFGRGGETLQCFGNCGRGESLIFVLGFGSCVAAVGSWEFLPGGICLHFLVFMAHASPVLLCLAPCRLSLVDPTLDSFG